MGVCKFCDTENVIFLFMYVLYTYVYIYTHNIVTSQPKLVAGSRTQQSTKQKFLAFLIFPLPPMTN